MVITRNQAGQGSVEFVLLMVLGVATIIGAVTYLRSSGFVTGVTVTPWATISGMIECGVWQPCGFSATSSAPALHPNNRVISYKPPGQP